VNSRRRGDQATRRHQTAGLPGRRRLPLGGLLGRKDLRPQRPRQPPAGPGQRGATRGGLVPRARRLGGFVRRALSLALLEHELRQAREAAPERLLVGRGGSGPELPQRGREPLVDLARAAGQRLHPAVEQREGALGRGLETQQRLEVGVGPHLEGRAGGGHGEQRAA
jgi:hypothetical protein